MSPSVGAEPSDAHRVPAERPELLAVHRSGEVILRAEWNSGDRSIPPAAPDFREVAERFPAAAGLQIGTDGLVCVQRWTVRDDRPVRGPGWLVFSSDGDLVARLEVRSAWRVLAFGDRAPVAAVYVGDNFQEVRVYSLDGVE